MIDVLARGCPSWTPVRGWQDLGGCWTPPGPAPWLTPWRLAALIVLAVIVSVVTGLCLALCRDNFRASRAARR